MVAFELCTELAKGGIRAVAFECVEVAKGGICVIVCVCARKHTTRNRATLHTSSYTWLFVTHNRATLHPSSNTWLFVTW